MSHGHEAGPYILTCPIGRLGINVDFLGQGLATVGRIWLIGMSLLFTVRRKLSQREAGWALVGQGLAPRRKAPVPDMFVAAHPSVRTDMTHPLPSSCERAILEQFLKAEAMALWAVRSAQAQDVPSGVLQFLRRHEEEEAQHLKQFELLLGTNSHGKTANSSYAQSMESPRGPSLRVRNLGIGVRNAVSRLAAGFRPRFWKTKKRMWGFSSRKSVPCLLMEALWQTIHDRLPSLETAATSHGRSVSSR